MRHQKILLELATQQEIDRERQRSIHTQSKPHQVQMRPPRRRKRSVFRDRPKKLAMVTTVILSLSLCRWLLSFQSFQRSSVSTSQHQPAKVLISPVDALSHAIITQESRDNHRSLNPHSQALGLAQVMPDNIGAWSQEALGYRISLNEFRHNRTAQKQIVHYKLNQYWQEALAKSNGDEELAVLRVASHWYSGDPDLHKSKATQWYKGADGKLHRYPSVSDYSKSVLQKYKQHMRGAGEGQGGQGGQGRRI